MAAHPLKLAHEIMANQINAQRLELSQLRSDSWSDAHAVQAELDPIFSAFGDRAPAPLVGESSTGYQKRGLSDLKRFSPTWKDQDVRALPDAALAVAKRQIISDAHREAAKPTALSLPADGRMITRIVADGMGMPRIKEYHALNAGACWNNFKRANAFVKAFNGKPVF